MTIVLVALWFLGISSLHSSSSEWTDISDSSSDSVVRVTAPPMEVISYAIHAAITECKDEDLRNVYLSCKTDSLEDLYVFAYFQIISQLSDFDDFINDDTGLLIRYLDATFNLPHSWCSANSQILSGVIDVLIFRYKGPAPYTSLNVMTALLQSIKDPFVMYALLTKWGGRSDYKPSLCKVILQYVGHVPLVCCKPSRGHTNGTVDKIRETCPDAQLISYGDIYYIVSVPEEPKETVEHHENDMSDQSASTGSGSSAEDPQPYFSRYLDSVPAEFLSLLTADDKQEHEQVSVTSSFALVAHAKWILLRRCIACFNCSQWKYYPLIITAPMLRIFVEMAAEIFFNSDMLFLADPLFQGFYSSRPEGMSLYEIVNQYTSQVPLSSLNMRYLIPMGKLIASCMEHVVDLEATFLFVLTINNRYLHLILDGLAGEASINIIKRFPTDIKGFYAKQLVPLTFGCNCYRLLRSLLSGPLESDNVALFAEFSSMDPWIEPLLLLDFVPCVTKICAAYTKRHPEFISRLYSRGRRFREASFKPDLKRQFGLGTQKGIKRFIKHCVIHFDNEHVDENTWLFSQLATMSTNTAASFAATFQATGVYAAIRDAIVESKLAFPLALLCDIPRTFETLDGKDMLLYIAIVRNTLFVFENRKQLRSCIRLLARNRTFLDHLNSVSGESDSFALYHYFASVCEDSLYDYDDIDGFINGHL